MPRHKRMVIDNNGHGAVLGLPNIEIWDGSDLALIRDTLAQLIGVQKCRRIAVDMRWVKFVPSGFFGMLCDWRDRGTQVRLFAPQPHVRNMLWFRQFFDHEQDDWHLMRSGPKQTLWSSTPTICHESVWTDHEAVAVVTESDSAMV